MKTPQEILAEWADPETGGTMPREVREAALSVVADLYDARHSLAHCVPGRQAAEARVKELEAKLQRVRDWIKFAANSESGIVAEIDSALEP